MWRVVDVQFGGGGEAVGRLSVASATQLYYASWRYLAEDVDDDEGDASDASDDARGAARAAARRCFASASGRVSDMSDVSDRVRTSKTQRAAADAFRALGSQNVELEREITLPLRRRGGGDDAETARVVVDVVAEMKEIIVAVEIDGPTHFLSSCSDGDEKIGSKSRKTGGTALRDYLLSRGCAAAGYGYVSIPHAALDAGVEEAVKAALARIKIAISDIR
mmetsp:Transcript_6042/g.22095  ORF Transcript_6042/g.22095 Transcript_6042/m.22095 type:complete len:221 (-) Transcript_6042:122-784(-)